jgi:aminoglycoside phosphotransferase (APT) family kinase protein
LKPDVDDDRISSVVTRVLGRRPRRVELVPTGEYNAVYRIEFDEERVYLKAHDPESILVEAWAYAAAERARVPTAQVLAVEESPADLDCSFFIVSEVAGTPLDRVGDDDRRATIAIELGRHLRALHALPMGGYGWIDFDHLRATGVGRGEAPDEAALIAKDHRSLEVLPTHGLLDAATVDAVKAILNEGSALFADSPSALLHGDVGPKHVLVGNSSITGLIDWGDARAGDPVWDLTCFALHAADLLSSLIAGYEPSDPLLDDKLAITTLIRLIGEALWVYERGGDPTWRLERVRHMIARRA